MTNWISLIPAFSAVFAIMVYYRQQQLTRLQNILSVFQRFSNNTAYVKIFSLSDQCYVLSKDTNTRHEMAQPIIELQDFSVEEKYKYLALLEEIALYAKHSSIIKKSAIHLFRFHFFYVYGNHQFSEAFWQNVGGGIKEKNEDGWSYQRDFSKECIKSIKFNYNS